MTVIQDMPFHVALAILEYLPIEYSCNREVLECIFNQRDFYELFYHRANPEILLTKLTDSPASILRSMIFCEVKLMGRELEVFCNSNEENTIEMPNWNFQLSPNYYQQSLFLKDMIDMHNLEILSFRNTSYTVLRYKTLNCRITKRSEVIDVVITIPTNKDEFCIFPFGSIYGTEYVMHGIGYTRADSHVYDYLSDRQSSAKPNKKNILVDTSNIIVDDDLTVSTIEVERKYLNEFTGGYVDNPYNRHLGDKKSFSVGWYEPLVISSNSNTIKREYKTLLRVWKHNYQSYKWKDAGTIRIFNTIDKSCRDCDYPEAHIGNMWQDCIISLDTIFLGYNLLLDIFTSYDIVNRLRPNEMIRYDIMKGNSEIDKISVDYINQLWESNKLLVPQLGRPTDHDIRFISEIIKLSYTTDVRELAYSVFGPHRYDML